MVFVYWCSNQSGTKSLIQSYKANTGIKGCLNSSLSMSSLFVKSILFPHYDLKHMNALKSEEWPSEEHTNALKVVPVCKKVVPTWNSSQQGLWIILCNRVMISKKKHYCWVFQIYIFYLLLPLFIFFWNAGVSSWSNCFLCCISISSLTRLLDN